MADLHVNTEEEVLFYAYYMNVRSYVDVVSLLQVEEKPDPLTFRTDLYDAAKRNDSVKVMEYLALGVPPSYIDFESQLTVCNSNIHTIIY